MLPFFVFLAWAQKEMPHPYLSSLCALILPKTSFPTPANSAVPHLPREEREGWTELARQAQPT